MKQKVDFFFLYLTHAMDELRRGIFMSMHFRTKKEIYLIWVLFRVEIIFASYVYIP